MYMIYIYEHWGTFLLKIYKILYYQLSSEKYDIKEGFRIPDCNVVLSIK
jgi:hypothetical protein